MPKITGHCPQCQARFRVDDSNVGKNARCKKCDTKFVIQQAVAEDEVADKWSVGDVILDLYEVKHIHEAGGMGLVYRVNHRGWNLDLAVKSPRAELFQTEDQKAFFFFRLSEMSARELLHRLGHLLRKKLLPFHVYRKQLKKARSLLADTAPKFRGFLAPSFLCRGRGATRSGCRGRSPLAPRS